MNPSILSYNYRLIRLYRIYERRLEQLSEEQLESPSKARRARIRDRLTALNERSYRAECKILKLMEGKR